MHGLVHRGEAFVTNCIQQEASIDFYRAGFMGSIFIPSHHIFLSLPPSHVPFFSFVWFSVSAFAKINVMDICPGLCGEGEGGQQVEHKHTCLPHPLYLPSWGCWAEGPISGPSEPCTQHCQAQLPVEHTGLTLQTACGNTGQAGRPSGWLLLLLLEGSMEHVKPQPASPGAPHGWTGLTLSGTWG